MARPEEDYGEAEAACIQGPLRIPQLSFLCTVFRVPQQMGRSSYCWRKLTKPPPLAPIKWHSHGAEPKIGPVCEDMAPPSPAQSPGSRDVSENVLPIALGFQLSGKETLKVP